MERLDTVAIVGVGLIGGSIGLALRDRGLADVVVGIGRRQSSLRKARRCGAVTQTTTDIPRGVRRAQLVVVCTPVGAVAQRIRAVAAAAAPGTLITDAASTKEQIVADAEAYLRGAAEAIPRDVRFVGSHPLAGDHRAGPEHASADLFEGRTVVVTPTGRSRAVDVRQLDQFWSALGAQVVTMRPRQHDQALAATSHLPHLVAAAVAAATPAQDLPLTATGWLDTTRVAAGSPSLWQEILMGNRKHVLRSLTRLEKTLAAFREALEHDQQRTLERLLAKGKSHRDAVEQ
jgi:prephenate dehydrogenase